MDNLSKWGVCEFLEILVFEILPQSFLSSRSIDDNGIDKVRLWDSGTPIATIFFIS